MPFFRHQKKPSKGIQKDFDYLYFPLKKYIKGKVKLRGEDKERIKIFLGKN